MNTRPPADKAAKEGDHWFAGDGSEWIYRSGNWQKTRFTQEFRDRHTIQRHDAALAETDQTRIG